MTCDKCGIEYVQNGHRPGSAACLVLQIVGLKAKLAFAYAEHKRLEAELNMARTCLERMREQYREDLIHTQKLVDKLEAVLKIHPEDA